MTGKRLQAGIQNVTLNVTIARKIGKTNLKWNLTLALTGATFRPVRFERIGRTFQACNG